jgi:hypothetical protein
MGYSIMLLENVNEKYEQAIFPFHIPDREYLLGEKKDRL